MFCHDGRSAVILQTSTTRFCSYRQPCLASCCQPCFGVLLGLEELMIVGLGIGRNAHAQFHSHRLQIKFHRLRCSVHMLMSYMMVKACGAIALRDGRRRRRVAVRVTTRSILRFLMVGAANCFLTFVGCSLAVWRLGSARRARRSSLPVGILVRGCLDGASGFFVSLSLPAA